MSLHVRKAAITVKDYVFRLCFSEIQNIANGTLHHIYHTVSIGSCHLHFILLCTHYKSAHHFHLYQLFFKLSCLLSVLKMLVFNFPLPPINHQLPLACLAQLAFVLFSFLVSLVQHHNFL